MSVADRLRLGVMLLAGVPALRASDILLASFPRSGSTLLRFVVTHYALGLAGDASEVPFARLNRLAPELGASWLWSAPLQPGAPRGRFPRWVKTHRPYFWGLARPRAVHLVRSPLDALASYHRYWTARVGAAPVERGAFLRDPRRGLPRWIRHTRSWEGHADVVLRYRDLRADPARAVTEVLSAFGVDVDAQTVAEAAARSSADAVRALERSGGVAGPDRLGAGAVFAADRPPGSGTAYFSPSDVAWARARLTEAGLGAWVGP